MAFDRTTQLMLGAAHQSATRSAPQQIDQRFAAAVAAGIKVSVYDRVSQIKRQTAKTSADEQDVGQLAFNGVVEGNAIVLSPA